LWRVWCGGKKEVVEIQWGDTLVRKKEQQGIGVIPNTFGA